MTAELQRTTSLVLEAAELALPALASPQDINIGASLASTTQHVAILTPLIPNPALSLNPIYTHEDL